MRSMTGYGKGTAEWNGLELTVEVKTVNGRFTEINNRIPKMFASCDTYARGLISQRIKRGSVEVYYNYRNTATGDVHLALDQGLIQQYLTFQKVLCEEYGLKDDFSVSSLLRTPDIVKQEELSLSDDVKQSLVDRALNAALAGLDSMRLAEGETLRAHLLEILERISENLDAIVSRAPSIISAYKTRLFERVQAVLADVPLDENKLLNEVSYYVDKVDTNEEMQRLRSHIEQFKIHVSSGNEAGRQLEFIIQEMTRETNTIGSKCSDLDTTNLVLNTKNELERLREQIRNAE